MWYSLSTCYKTFLIPNLYGKVKGHLNLATYNDSCAKEVYDCCEGDLVKQYFKLTQ